MSRRRAVRVAVLFAMLVAVPHISIIDAENSDTEPNDGVTNASPLNLTGGPVAVPGSLTASDRFDYYLLNLTNATPLTQVNLTLNFTAPAYALVNLLVQDPNLFTVARANTTGAEVRLRFLSLTGGTYYILVQRDPTSAAGAINYTLAAESSTSQALSDGNNGPQDAVSVTDGTTVAAGADNLTDPADFYRIHLDALWPSRSDVFLARLAVPAGGDMAVEVYGANSSGPEDPYPFKARADAGGAGANESIFFYATASGDYLIRVWAARGGGTYTLTLVASTAEVEGNEVPASATTAAKGDVITSNLTMDIDPKDYYRVWLNSSDTLSPVFNATSYNATSDFPDLSITILHPLNYTLASAAGGPGKAVSADADVSGWYTVVMSARYGFGPYRLTLSARSAPVVGVNITSITIMENSRYLLDLNTVFLDPDGDTLSYEVSGNLSVAVTVNSTGWATLVPRPYWRGSEPVTFTARDPAGKSRTLTLQVIVQEVNTPPAPVMQPPDQAMSEDTVANSTFLPADVFYDPDEALGYGDAVRYNATATENVSVVVESGDRPLRFIPAPDRSGRAAVTLTASDLHGGYSSVTFNLTVLNTPDAPRAVQPPPEITFSEDTTYMLDLLALFRDPDGDILNFSVKENGTLQAFAVDHVPQLSLSAPANWSGTTRIVVVATDPGGLGTELALNVTVTAVDDPPVLLPIPRLSLREETDFYLNVSEYVEDSDTPITLMGLQSDSSYGRVVSTVGLRLVLRYPHGVAADVFNITVFEVVNRSLSARAAVAVGVEQVHRAPVLENPYAGVDGTRAVFRVDFRGDDAVEPVVYLQLDGKNHTMKRKAGSANAGTYELELAVGAGTHEYRFMANDGSGAAGASASSPLRALSVSQAEAPPLLSYAAALILAMAVAGGLAWWAAKRRREMAELDRILEEPWEDERLRRRPGKKAARKGAKGTARRRPGKRRGQADE